MGLVLQELQLLGAAEELQDPGESKIFPLGLPIPTLEVTPSISQPCLSWIFEGAGFTLQIM